MRDDRAEMIELLKGLTEAVKLVVDRGGILLSYFLTIWLDVRATHAPLPAPTIERTEKPMTVKEAAEFYGVQENTIYELVKRREIRFIKIGESLRIPPIQPVEPLTTLQPCATKRRRNVLQ